MLRFSYKILKKDLQRSDVTPQIKSIDYLKIYFNTIDNKHYLSNIFIKLLIMKRTYIKNKKLLMIYLII